MSSKQWKEYRFSDFVEINPPLKLDNKKEYSFIEMKDLENGQKFAYPSLKRKVTGGARFEEKDTLFARITPCLENGKICQASNLENGIGFGSTEFLVFRGKKDISDTEFVFYLSRWNEVRKFAEQNLVGTSGRQRVGKDAFKNLQLNLPSLFIQCRIASILSSLDEKIELNRQTNQTLDAIAQAIFNEWFIDFNFPGATGKMQESELGAIPKGWKLGCIGDLFTISKESMNPSLFPEQEFIHYSLPAFDEGKKASKQKGIEILSNKFKVKNNSILVSKLNPRIPRIWPIIDAEINALSSTEFLVLLPVKPLCFSFGVTLFSQPSIIEIMKGRATGTSGSHQRIRPQDMLDIQIIIPDEKYIELFDLKIKPLFTQIKNNEEQNETLTQLRDTLLPKLMKGEIPIPEI